MQLAPNLTSLKGVMDEICRTRTRMLKVIKVNDLRVVFSDKIGHTLLVEISASLLFATDVSHQKTTALNLRDLR